MFRKILFWSHLACGIAAGLVIAVMAFTGVLLTYEQQLLGWAEQADYVEPDRQTSRLSLEALKNRAREIDPQTDFTSATVFRNPGAPVVFSAGRRAPSLSLNPYTGDPMSVGSPSLESFFDTVTGVHRWFNLEGKGREAARAITGASNLMFLLLILSGLYLWLPRVWKWTLFRTRLLFNSRAGSARARDFNWHHVFGIWSALPLAVVVATASVFYYDWAENLVYWSFGEGQETSSRPAASTVSVPGTDTGAAARDFLPLDRLVDSAGDIVPLWREISVNLPEKHSPSVTFELDESRGRRPQYRHTLKLDRHTGTLLTHEPFSERGPGSKARTLIRYLHTGEVFGFWGQTIAGLVSLTSGLMVWTGLALAWRRLIQPLFKRGGQP